MLGVLAAPVALIAAGCGDGGLERPDSGLDPNIPPVTQGNWYRPAVSSTWQWQLQGLVDTGYDVDVYDIDLFDAPTTLITQLHNAGRKVICYFSAGSFEDFRPDAQRFRAEELGKPLGGFPDERWLDIRSANVLEIMRDRLNVAVQKNCDGVEPDNVDGYINDTGFPLSATDQLAFNRVLANEAHARDLSVALKNDLDQVRELVDYVDFSVNEQCHEFDECDMLRPFILAGKPIFNAEYADRFVNDPVERQNLCATALSENIRTLILPVELDDSFRFTCEAST